MAKINQIKKTSYRNHLAKIFILVQSFLNIHKTSDMEKTLMVLLQN